VLLLGSLVVKYMDSASKNPCFYAKSRVVVRGRLVGSGDEIANLHFVARQMHREKAMRQICKILVIPSAGPPRAAPDRGAPAAWVRPQKPVYTA
jgi:hypothetical protein